MLCIAMILRLPGWPATTVNRTFLDFAVSVTVFPALTVWSKPHSCIALSNIFGDNHIAAASDSVLRNTTVDGLIRALL